MMNDAATYGTPSETTYDTGLNTRDTPSDNTRSDTRSITIPYNAGTDTQATIPYHMHHTHYAPLPDTAAYPQKSGTEDTLNGTDTPENSATNHFDNGTADNHFDNGTADNHFDNGAADNHFDGVAADNFDNGATDNFDSGSKVELRKSVLYGENLPQTRTPPHSVQTPALPGENSLAFSEPLATTPAVPVNYPVSRSPESSAPPHRNNVSPKPHSVFIAPDITANAPDAFPESSISPDAKTDISPDAQTDISPDAKMDISPDVQTNISPEADIPHKTNISLKTDIPPDAQNAFPEADTFPDTDILPPSDMLPETDVPDMPDGSTESPVVSPMSDEELTRHTAELWKYHPVPKNLPEPFDEYSSDQLSFSGGQIFAARVRGKKHKHEGSNCDDWFEVKTAGCAAVIALSDGAGSKAFSRIGARDSCRAASGYLVQSLPEFFAAHSDWKQILRADSRNPLYAQTCAELAGLVQNAVEKAREAVSTAYYTRAADPLYTDCLKRPPQETDFSATLLLAAVLPLSEPGEKHSQQLIVTCQIGDGIMAALDTFARTPEVKLLGTPDSGTFTGETEFLTSRRVSLPDALKSRTRVYRGPANMVFVMTDGVADDYFPAQTQMTRLYFDLLVNAVLPLEDAPHAVTEKSPAPFPNTDAPSGTVEQSSKHVPSGTAAQSPDTDTLQNKTNPSVLQDKAPSTLQNRKLPDPVTFPWINDRTKLVSLQYTRRICSALGMTLEDLWNDPSALILCRTPPDEPADPDMNHSQMLLRWLDNYVERGSFDDRTLVVVRM